MAAVASPSVIYVVPDKMGGMLNILDGLLRYRRADHFAHGIVLTHNPLSADTRFGGCFKADYQATFEYRLPVENIHSVVRRLRGAIPRGEGVLVANDMLELAMASAHDCNRAVLQILHGDHDYYYDLAARHEAAIDAFVVYGRTMERKLRQRLPHRSGDVYFLPYGLPLPAKRRTAMSGPLRVLFAGRYEHGQKGVLDLPLIDRALVERGVDVAWTMVGAGPDEVQLRAAWRTPRVDFAGLKTTDDVMEISANHDVFILPTRHEGVPVALLEAMSVGLVPVVSRVESGVAEILSDGVTGMMPPVGDIGAFADAIAALDRDRSRLESMSEAAWRYVAAHHDVRARTDGYQTLFAQYRELRRPRSPHGVLPYGSTLDRPWIPNVAVRTVRTMIRRAQGKPY